MIPLATTKGVLVKRSSTTIGEDKSPFHVYSLQLDCYIPELDMSAEYSQCKNQDGNLQHYVRADELSQNGVFSKLTIGKPYAFRVATFAKMSGKSPKVKLVFLNAKEI